MTAEIAIGTVIDEVDFPVEEGKLREFAVAVGADDPAAVPLTFVTVAGHWRDQAAMVEKLGLNLPKIVVGGSEWEYGDTPIAVGDRLKGARVVTGVERKQRPNGTMTLISIETRFTRADGAHCVTQRDTVIELP